MRIPRIHVPPPLATGSVVELPAQAGEHLVRVLRLGPGAELRLFDGHGNEHAARLVSCARRAVSAEVLEALADPGRESPLAITLAQGIARGEKMDWILQKATELGVAAIVPLATERSEVRLDAERGARRFAHWQAVLAGACEQCGRNRLPRLHAPVPLGNWAAGLGEGSELRLILDPQGELSLGALPPATQITLAIGPEGGLGGRDLAMLAAAGFRGLRLGPRILRTETAGLAALAALQALQGDLQ